MSVQLSLGNVMYTQDLDGVSATTTYPSGSSAGIQVVNPTAIAPTSSGTRVHLMMRYQAASGTLSTICSLYGYNPTTGHWPHIGSLNGGSSITANTSKWSPDTSTIVLAEAFTIGPNQYSRFASRVVAPQGTTILISTWIGYERE